MTVTELLEWMIGHRCQLTVQREPENNEVVLLQIDTQWQGTTGSFPTARRLLLSSIALPNSCLLERSLQGIMREIDDAKGS